MSNLIGTDLRTPEFVYAYIQSMSIALFASFRQTIASNSSTNQPIINDFVQEEQPIVLDKQLQPQEHEQIRRELIRNMQPLKCETGGHRRY